MNTPEKMIGCYVQHPHLNELIANIGQEFGLKIRPSSSLKDLFKKNNCSLLWLIVELSETDSHANEELEKRCQEKFSIPIAFFKVHSSKADPKHPIEIRIAFPNESTDYLHNILQKAYANPLVDLRCERRSELEKNYKKLTNREKEVFRLVTEGKHNKEIARLLSISKRTVELHRSHILHKMEMDSFIALACSHISDLI